MSWLKKRVRSWLDLEKKEPDLDTARKSLIVTDFLSIDKYIQQPWDYRLLVDFAENHPVLGTVIEAIQREATREGWDPQPRFIKRCTLCGRQHNTEVTKCEACGAGEGSLADPDPMQRLRFEAFFKDPNNKPTDPWRIYVEDSALIFICYDKYGRLGNNIYYCTVCWDFEHQMKTMDKKQAVDFNYECEFCGGPIRETCYVHVVNGMIQRRFHRDQIIHRNSSGRLPHLYGAPKPVKVLRQLRTILAMDVNQFYTYTKGRMEKIFLMMGISQTEANKIAAQIQEQKNKLSHDPLTGNIMRVPTSLFLGSGSGVSDIKPVDMMATSEEMQSLEWWEKNAAIIGGVYGCQPIMQPGTQQTQTGYHQRMQVIVQNDSTRAVQKAIEDPLNETLLPKMGITDWLFKFNEIETRNELGEAQVFQAKVAAVVSAKQAGMEAEITQEGEVKISTPEDWELPEPTMPDGTTGFMVERPKPPVIPGPQSQQAFSQTKAEKDVVYEVRVKSGDA
jgi:hypothetical protein